MDFGFGHIGLSEIVSFTTKLNTRSIRVMQRLGMTHNINDDFAHPKLAPDDPLSPHLLYRMRASTFKVAAPALQDGENMTL